MREIVLAQRDQNAVVAAREVELLDRVFVALDPRLDLLGRTVLDQVREVLDELRGAPAAEVVSLRQCEDLLELVEDQKWRECLAGTVAQQVVPVVQEFPQRFTGRRKRRVSSTRPTPRWRERSPP